MSHIRENNNFDFLRLIMALSVFFYHSFALTAVADFKVLTYFFSGTVAVNCFYILSGFLIFMSYEKTSTLKTYAKKRSARIVPAYVLVVVFSSLAGLILTTLPVNEYFSFQWLKYLTANLLTLNFIEPTLPGVFTDNKLSAVNGALWTIKIEIMFYIAVPFIVYLNRKKSPIIVLTILYVLSIIYYKVLFLLHQKTGILLYRQFYLLLPGSLCFFVSGGLLYYYFDVFKANATKYLIGAIIGWLVFKYFNFYYLMPISLAVIVVYVALIFKYLGNFARFGDLSYGIYIWHFPIIQTLIYFYLYENPLLGFSLSLILVFLFSFASWHLIEKRFLRKDSHYISASEQG